MSSSIRKKKEKKKTQFWIWWYWEKWYVLANYTVPFSAHRCSFKFFATTCNKRERICEWVSEWVWERERERKHADVRTSTAFCRRYQMHHCWFESFQSKRVTVSHLNSKTHVCNSLSLISHDAHPTTSPHDLELSLDKVRQFKNLDSQCCFSRCLPPALCLCLCICYLPGVISVRLSPASCFWLCSQSWNASSSGDLPFKSGQRHNHPCPRVQESI